MTRHYPEKNIEDMTVELIYDGWEQHGNQLPLGYMTSSEGDWVAYTAWRCYGMELSEKTRKMIRGAVEGSFPKDKEKIEKAIYLIEGFIKQFWDEDVTCMQNQIVAETLSLEAEEWKK